MMIFYYVFFFLIEFLLLGLPVVFCVRNRGFSSYLTLRTSSFLSFVAQLKIVTLKGLKLLIKV